MRDFKYLTICDHKLYDEILTIEGTSPSFFVHTKHDTTRNKKTTFIREYNIVEKQTTVVQSRDGITNYLFNSSDATLITFPFDITTNSVDGREGIVPGKIYLIDYVTTPENCPKCLNTNVVKDITYDSGGRLLTVTGEEKLKQTVLKAVLTKLGANLYDENYGGGVHRLIGEKINIFTSIRLQQIIQDAVNHLIEIQSTEDLTDAEKIHRINDIGVTQDVVDPTIFNISIIITNGNWSEVSVNLKLELI